MSRNFKFLFCVIAIFAVNISAQVYRDTKPNVQISCSESPVRAGETTTFTVTVKPDSKLATYNWTISNGTIVKGQGTPIIDVEMPAESVDSVTATVEIGGGIWFERLSESCTVSIIQNPKARLLEQFPHSTQGYIKMKLDGSLFLELQNDPNASGYVFIFPKTSKEKIAIERIIRNQIKVRNFDASRITIVEGAKNSRSIIQFWSIPAGAEVPLPKLKS